MTCLTSLTWMPLLVPFLFPLFLADLDKKYRNEIGMDKNNSGTYMDYDYF